MLEGDSDSAVFIVRDTGVGIRPEVIAGLFEPFQQASQELSRSAGGLGLGLAVAKGLVELHDGTIEAHSAGPGAGAEFVVRLPLAAAPPEERRAKAAAVSPRRILVVEDNADAAQSLRNLLEMLGHSVDWVGTGAEALELLSQRRVDVLLCDLGLPGMSGYDVVRAIRGDAALKKTPVVAVTGYGQPEDRRRTEAAGFDRHLVYTGDPPALPGRQPKFDNSWSIWAELPSVSRSELHEREFQWTNTRVSATRGGSANTTSCSSQSTGRRPCLAS